MSIINGKLYNELYALLQGCYGVSHVGVIGTGTGERG